MSERGPFESDRAEGCARPAPEGRQRDSTGLFWAIGLFYLFLTAAKFAIGGQLDLFYDEATYWQAAQRLDFGYMHTAAVTPLLIRLGTLVFGDTLFGVRVVTLLVVAALPFAIYWLALPLVGRRDAVLAAGVSLIMPITALLGEAYMDPPMLLFTTLGLAAFERARRTHSTWLWVAAGLFCACGLATHYRFLPFPLGLFAYVTLTRQGRALWRRKGLWIFGFVMALGVLPLALFNLKTGFAGFEYQVVDRNPWAFQVKGLRYPLEQMGVVTPLLFLALMGALVAAVRRARAGDDACALLASCAIVYLGFYLVLAPFSDSQRMYVHWPVAGYIPLFVLLPGVLRRFAAGGGSALAAKARRAFVWLVPATGGLAVLAGLFYLAASAWPPLFPDFLYGLVRHELVAWSRLEKPVTRYLEEDFEGDPAEVALVASSYRVGSELEFLLGPEEGVWFLDHRKNREEGIWPQYLLWEQDEDSLRRTRADAEALVVIQDVRYWGEIPEELVWRAGLCDRFEDLRYLGDFEFQGGRKHFLFYAARVRGLDDAAGKGPAGAYGPGNCPALPSAFLARPKRGAQVSGRVTVNGWALDDAVGVDAVELLVDGEAVVSLDYGLSRPTVQRLMPGSTDPNHPNVGFAFEWDTDGLARGPHQLAIRVRSADGAVRDFGERTVFLTGW